MLNNQLPTQNQAPGNMAPMSMPSNTMAPMSMPSNTMAPMSMPSNAMAPMSMPSNAMAPMSMPMGKKHTSMMPMSMPGMMMHGAATTPLPVQTGAATPIATTLPGVPATEESYVENILRMNLGKVATLYMTYENNSEWNAKIFKGVLEAAGRDHIIISDPKTGRRFLLLTLNLDYITFDEPLNYTLPFGTMGTPAR